MPTMHQEATNGRCKAMTKAGGSCAAPAIRGGEFCALHSDPGRAAELGRKGGLRNRHVYENDSKEVATPQTASDVKNLLADAMAEIRAGKMDPKLPVHQQIANVLQRSLSEDRKQRYSSVREFREALLPLVVECSTAPVITARPNTDVSSVETLIGGLGTEPHPPEDT